MRKPTRVMCPFQGLVVLVEMAHDGLPNEAGLLKLLALFGQLLPDVFPLENVLEGWKKEESEDACGRQSLPSQTPPITALPPSRSIGAAQ